MATPGRPASGLVELRDLTGARELSGLQVLYLAHPASPVRELALVTDIEEISGVGPDTVILLTQEVARGGWMISAALRYAWERRACALIVPEQSITDSVIKLARRFEISLFTTELDMRALAIETAIQIGVARAGHLARAQQFAERVSHAREVTEVLRLTSAELEHARVAIETAGAETLHVPGGQQPHRGIDTHMKRVTVSIDSVDSEVDALVAEVPERMAALADQILRTATPTMRALLADARLQSTRDSLPVVSIAALSGIARARGIDDPSTDLIIDELDWPVAGDFSAIFIMARSPEQTGTAVHQLWVAELETVPLARLVDGWIGFAPISSRSARTALLGRLRERLERLGALGVVAGVSDVYASPRDALASVREAWIAARAAEPADAAGASAAPLVEFGALTSRLIPRLLPRPLADQLAQILLPELMKDPAADEIVAAVVSYLSHRGSASAAAAALGVHRNTLQARLRRAEELGARLSDPAQVLPLHMLLAALSVGRAQSHSG